MLHVVSARNPVLPEGYDAVVRDMKKAYDVVVVRRKYDRDISERWFGVTSVEASVVRDSSGLHGVRISKVVEVGEVEYLPECVLAPQLRSTSYRSKSPQNRTVREVKCPLQLFPSVVLSLTMSQLCCLRNGWSYLMTPILKSP